MDLSRVMNFKIYRDGWLVNFKESSSYNDFEEESAFKSNRIYIVIIIENIEIHLRIEDLKGIFNNLKNSYM